MCHTGILHQVAHLDSIFNVVLHRCSNLVLSALECESQLVREVFATSSQLVYSALGYNTAFKSRHQKFYTEQDCLCATFIRDVRLAPDVNYHLFDEVYFMSVPASYDHCY